jgi:hypothetical protein
VIAAAGSPARDIAIPLFVTSVTAERYGVGGFGGGPAAGLPIYNLDGGLLAVSAGDGTAWRIRYALDRLLSRAASGAMPASIGVTVQAIDQRLSEAFGTAGLAIVDVAPGGPAAAAGVEPGDVMIGVGEPPNDRDGDLAAMLAALPPGSPVRLSLRRGGRDLSATVTPSFAYEAPALARPPADAPRADALFAGEALAAASVPPDAAVVLINGRAVGSAAQAARDLRRSKGAALALLEHRGRRFFAAIEITR